MTLYTATLTLILVMDPLGNIPIFLSVLNKTPAKQHTLIILRESIIALLVLTVFLLFGKDILTNMQISESALSISGGIILFLIAIRMIFPHDETQPRAPINTDPFIVPLAIPMIAGPSTMTVVMLLASQEPTKITLWMAALLVAWLITTTILIFANRLRKILGEKGLIAIERLMGMILTTMAVQMFLTGVAKFHN